MDYIESNFIISPRETGSEILIAMLADVGFESFVETEMGVLAYIPETNFSDDRVKNLAVLHSKKFSISYNYKKVTDKNWNEEWEKSYNSVVIAGECCVRAPNHSKVEGCKYDIIIEPKKSFGTAHHETTALMIEQMLQLNLKGKLVLDMGCGTGVLAILAAKMGASNISAIDIDEWAFNSTNENINKNNVRFVKVFLGDFQMATEQYDIIFANINRNVLLHDIVKYTRHLYNSGILLLSGFYEEDIPIVKNKAESKGLKFSSSSIKNKWAVLKFNKIN